jgi:hypothetical protein
MTERAPRLEWLPPLLVGASAAVAAEVALAMLLYGGPGFVRSLTTILAVEGFALAGGLWSAPPPEPDLVDRLRRRWLLCLFSSLAAAAFGTSWTFVPWLGEERVGQAAGLAILAALPLYSSGSLLGGMSVAAATDRGRRLRSPGAAAAVGGALGFVLTGLLLPRAPMPASLLVGCLVMLSLGGMVFGSVLGARTEVVVHARRPGSSSEVSVEERTRPIDDIALIELREGAFVRRWRALEEEEGRAWWDVAVARALVPDEHAEWRVLVVGGGCTGVVRAALREHPTATVEVIERTAAVVELGREYFDTELMVGTADRSTVAVGNLDDALEAIGYGYHLVVVDTAALAPLGGLRGLSTASLSALYGIVTPGGVIAWGPVGSEPAVEALPAGWSRVVLRRPAADVSAGSELVVLTGRGSVLERLPVPEGFQTVAGAPPPAEPHSPPSEPSDALAEAPPR